MLYAPVASAIESRIVRYVDLVPCLNAFIDTRTPGSETKENFTIIGPGVSENPDQYVHIAEPHGFNIGGAQLPSLCMNSQHSHETAEVFFVHSGEWQFDFGENGGDASIEAGAGGSHAPQRLAGPEVLFVHAGSLDVQISKASRRISTLETR